MAEKKIGARTFKVEPLLATRALVLQARLMKTIGPAIDRLPEVMAGVASGSDDAKAKANAAALAAFADIFAKSEPEAIAALIRDVVEIAQIKGDSGSYRSVDMDGDFSDTNLKDLLPVAVFVLQEQFSDFFSGLLGSGILGKLAKA